MPDPLFVEVTRGDTVESRHYGAAVVCDHRGNVLESWGDTDRLMFPRSALKPMLAIDLVASGAAAQFGLGDAELAMACSSHQGEAMHQDIVTGWLDRFGLGPEYVACGADMPDDIQSAHNVLAAGKPACRVYHNCSGKHAGFLTVALHLGLSLDGFHRADHPLQQMSLNGLFDLAGLHQGQYPVAIDGCGFPAPTMPLVQLGRAVARFARPEGLLEKRKAAIYRLHEALAHEPFYAAGHGTIVSDLNRATGGAVLAKTGAEGVLTAAVPAHGLGIALKISDGNARARPVALLRILDHLGPLSEDEKSQLQAHISPQIVNSRGRIVGKIRPANSWLIA